MNAPALATKATRLHSLDILRGLAIFGMVFSSRIPAQLPQWMHHDQFYNSDGKLISITGLTWVDIVYPFFIFSLGAAIPFALSRRIEENTPLWKLVGHIFWRALILCGFAYYLGNAAPWRLQMSDNLWMWTRTLIGFFCLILFLARLPFIPDDKKLLKLIPKIIGLAGIVILMATLKRKDGSGFSFDQFNIIILMLSRIYLTASLVWLITRKSLHLRLAVLAGIFAFHLHNVGDGLILTTVNQGLQAAHLKWFYGIDCIFVSSIAIFGSILGDMLYRYTQTLHDPNDGLGLPASKLAVILTALPALTVGGLCFLQSRHVYWGMLFTVALCLTIHLLLKETQTPMGTLVRDLFKWSALLLILAYIIEPYQGGIKKTPATLSYYLMTAGMAASLLTFFFILLDGLKVRKGIGLLQVAGSNPMLAYITGGHFVEPIFYLTFLIHPIHKLAWSNVAWGTLWGVTMTLIILFTVAIFTRKKIYLRV